MPLPIFWFGFLPFWRRAEIRAARFLRSQGYRVVAANYRVKEGEIDLVAWENDILVFVEVKSRQSEDPPEAAVGFRKQQRVIRAARSYIAHYKLHDATYRFDVVTVNDIPRQKPTCRLLRDAFRPGRSNPSN